MNQRTFRVSFFFCLFLLVGAGLSVTVLPGCGSTGKTCIEKAPELASMCQAPGSEWKLLAEGTEDCGRNGVYQPSDGGGGGRCNADGACSFSCTVSATVCPYGVSYITREEYACSAEPNTDCESGATQCVNGLYSECTNGKWTEPAECSGTQICERTADDSFGCVAGRLWSEIQDEAAGRNRGVSNAGEGQPTPDRIAGPACEREEDCEEGSFCNDDGDCVPLTD